MSGIAAVFNLDGRPVDHPQLERLIDAMAHRGRDGLGRFYDGQAALGHAMLRVTPESMAEVQPLRDGLEGGYFQEFEECFNGREGLGAVDVHWTMTPHAYPFAPSETAVRARAVNATLRGESVPTLAPDDLFLYLCVHGAKHGWCQFGWICDIAQLLAVPRLIDVATVLERAAPLGSRRMVLLAIYLAHAIDGVVEANLLDEARQSSAVVALGERAMRNLFTRLDGSLPLFDPWRVPVGAIEGAGSRARYVVRRLMAPTMGDFEMIPLPAALFPLYWVIRPFRMAVQYGPRLVRGAMGGAAAGSGNSRR